MKDLEIVENCKDWELNNFSYLYDKYIDKIYKYIYLKTSNREVSEDITSDVFMSALNAINKFNITETSSVQAWLYRIAHNKIIDYYKADKWDVSLVDYLDISEERDLWKDIDNKDKIKEILIYLKKVRKEHREIFILRIWNDLSYKEISEITWKTVDNCKKVVSRTMKSISENFILILLIILIF